MSHVRVEAERRCGGGEGAVEAAPAPGVEVEVLVTALAPGRAGDDVMEHGVQVGTEGAVRESRSSRGGEPHRRLNSTLCRAPQDMAGFVCCS